MDATEITKNLICSLALYGVVKGWPIDKLLKEYEHLEISLELVNEVLNGEQ